MEDGVGYADLGWGGFEVSDDVWQDVDVEALAEGGYEVCDAEYLDVSVHLGPQPFT